MNVPLKTPSVVSLEYMPTSRPLLVRDLPDLSLNEPLVDIPEHPPTLLPMGKTDLSQSPMIQVMSGDSCYYKPNITLETPSNSNNSGWDLKQEFMPLAATPRSPSPLPPERDVPGGDHNGDADTEYGDGQCSL